MAYRGMPAWYRARAAAPRRAGVRGDASPRLFLPAPPRHKWLASRGAPHGPGRHRRRHPALGRADAGRRDGPLRAHHPPRRHRPRARRQDGVHHLAGRQPPRPRPDAPAPRRRRGADPLGLPPTPARRHRAALRLRGLARRAHRSRPALARAHARGLRAAPVDAGAALGAARGDVGAQDGASRHRGLSRRVAARPRADGALLRRVERGRAGTHRRARLGRAVPRGRAGRRWRRAARRGRRPGAGRHLHAGAPRLSGGGLLRLHAGALPDARRARGARPR